MTHIIGEREGVENVTLSGSEIPSHNHPLNVAAGSSGTSGTPAGNYPAFDSDGLKEFSNTQNGSMNSATVKSTGNSLPHNNIQPCLAMTYCIALFGVYPSRS